MYRYGGAAYLGGGGLCGECTRRAEWRLGKRRSLFFYETSVHLDGLLGRRADDLLQRPVVVAVVEAQLGARVGLEAPVEVEGRHLRLRVRRSRPHVLPPLPHEIVGSFISLLG